MSVYEAYRKLQSSEALVGLGRALRRWFPHLSSIVLTLMLASAVTVLAAGNERPPDLVAAQSVLPTPTSPPTTPPTYGSGGFYYTVRPGDTLFRIALRYGTTVQAIVQANGIINPNQIFYGQVFWIPSSGWGTAGTATYYIVRRGDTLYSIARRFGTTYQALAAINGLSSPHRIYVGQRLVIRGYGTAVPPSRWVYVVRSGDTLWSIALRYGTSPWAIAEANGLWNLNLIYVGQRLVIP